MFHLPALTRWFALCLALSSAAWAPAAAGADTPGLVFWAVNEGGARIYRANALACQKITGLSTPLAQGLSDHLGVPAYTLALAELLPDEAADTCAFTLETPAGRKRCRPPSVMRTFGGRYLSRHYLQQRDGRVRFDAAICD